MRRAGVLLGLAVLFGAAGPAAAQGVPPALRPFPGTPPRSEPRLSPYLNLLRGGAPAANYYLGVIPEQQRRADEALFRGAIRELDERLDTPPGETELFTPLPSTGHATAFGNTGGFFGNPQPRAQQPAARPVTPPRRR